MPYKCESTHLIIKKENNRRIKLTDSDREKIKELYEKGLSQHALAREFKVV